MIDTMPRLTNILQLTLICIFVNYFCSCTITETEKVDGLVVHHEADTILFAVIGDFGLAGNPEQKVADMVKSWNPDFIITTGDNNYPLGELSTFKANVSDYYGDYIYNFDAPREYRCNGKAFTDSVNRFFPTPGNHDIKNPDGLLPYLDFFSLPGNEVNYSFHWGPVDFYSINSILDNMEEEEIWLEQEIFKSLSPFKIVFFHYPPFSPGPHGSISKMQWNFHKMGANAVICGHDHLYARITKKDEEGLYYLINGAGGRNLYQCDSSYQDDENLDVFCYDENYGAIKALATKDSIVFEFWAIDSPKLPIDRLVIKNIP